MRGHSQARITHRRGEYPPHLHLHDRGAMRSADLLFDTDQAYEAAEDARVPRSRRASFASRALNSIKSASRHLIPSHRGEKVQRERSTRQHRHVEEQMHAMAAAHNMFEGELEMLHTKVLKLEYNLKAAERREDEVAALAARHESENKALRALRERQKHPSFNDEQLGVDEHALLSRALARAASMNYSEDVLDAVNASFASNAKVDVARRSSLKRDAVLATADGPKLAAKRTSATMADPLQLPDAPRAKAAEEMKAKEEAPPMASPMLAELPRASIDSSGFLLEMGSAYGPRAQRMYVK